MHRHADRLRSFLVQQSIWVLNLIVSHFPGRTGEFAPSDWRPSGRISQCVRRGPLAVTRIHWSDLMQRFAPPLAAAASLKARPQCANQRPEFAERHPGDFADRNVGELF
jgi:hypothetical protein